MAKVRAFGRWPREFNETYDDPKLEAERKLARAIREALQAARLPPAMVAELEEMRERAEAQEAQDREQSNQQNAEALMTAVRSFGRWPWEHATSDDPKLEAERKLARDIREALGAARLPPAVVAELEEMRERAEEQETKDREQRTKQQAEALMHAVRAFGRCSIKR